MRLEKFQLQNYKKVRDTGLVKVRDLTVLVGKNEAGKSAILRGLSKLNPSDGEKYDLLKEFPRRRLTDEGKLRDWPAASGCFSLSGEEKTELVKICSLLESIKTVTVTRHYSWHTTTVFHPAVEARPVDAAELRGVIDNVVGAVQDLTAPDGHGDALAGLKEKVLAALQAAKNAVPSQPKLAKGNVDPTINALATNANEEWSKELLSPWITQLRALAERTEDEAKLEAAKKWVVESLPRFIYFANYDVMESAVHLPSFVGQMNSAPKARVTHCLFKHVGLDVSRLSTLGRHQQGQGGPNDAVRRDVDERAILASSASNAMTKKFEDWWLQRKHEFRYQIDGDYFRVWVRDDLDPSEIELDQRSAGMQYFFSFYVVFLVESEGAHAGNILLLDEPALHLHGTAQAKAVEFLRKLSLENQTIYTTHSPFMIDADHLEEARAVSEAEDGTTKVSEDVWPRDKDSLFPLQAALGYQLAQGLFLSKRQVIVEGLTVYWLLKALDHALGVLGRPKLRQGITLVPSGGTTRLFPLAGMLLGHEVEVVALLDGDEPGRREGKKLQEKLLSRDGRRCLFVGDFLTRKDGEIEDVFPEEEYLRAVKEVYPSVDPAFTPEERALSGVVNRVEALFKRQGLGEFEKWTVAANLRDRILTNPKKVAGETLGVAERIFAAINSSLPASGESDAPKHGASPA